MHLLHEAAARNVRGHVDAVAVDVILPAVVDAHDAAFLVDAEEEGRAPVGATLANQPNSAVGVAEGDEVLSQQPDAHGRAVILGHLFLQEEGVPVAPEKVSHRGAAVSSRKEFRFYSRQHMRLLSLLVPLALSKSLSAGRRFAGVRSDEPWVIVWADDDVL